MKIHALSAALSLGPFLAAQQNPPVQPQQQQREQMTIPQAQQPQQQQQRQRTQMPREQQPQATEPTQGQQQAARRTAPPPEEKTVTTHHSARIAGQQINYTATAGTYVITPIHRSPEFEGAGTLDGNLQKSGLLVQSGVAGIAPGVIAFYHDRHGYRFNGLYDSRWKNDLQGWRNGETETVFDLLCGDYNSKDNSMAHKYSLLHSNP